MYLESSVLLMCFLCLNVDLCCENLCLNVPSDVVLGCVVSCNLCVVDYTGRQAFVV